MLQEGRKLGGQYRPPLEKSGCRMKQKNGVEAGGPSEIYGDSFYTCYVLF